MLGGSRVSLRVRRVALRSVALAKEWLQAFRSFLRVMSKLESLKSAASLHDVAALLSYTPTTLAYLLYVKQTKYHSFEIGKRGGGSRTINAPFDELKLLQKNLSVLLQDCTEEINAAKGFKDQFAHGFKRECSIITNATKHRRKRYVLNLDLQDFFGTINFGRVRGFFITNRNFGLQPKVATILAQIACHSNVLPQGSPCSPVISNLIGNILDIHLARLASANGCTYSRYADDLTFSTNKPNFPSEIAKPVAGQPHVWELGDKLVQTITRSRFTVNPEKTRMQYWTSRQDVTGLVVNTKVNIRNEYRRTVRAMCHRLFMTGHFQHIELVADPSKPGILLPTLRNGTLPQLHGMLGHIYGVDRYNDELPKQLVNPVKPSLNTKENLYRRFLIFKEFYAATQPVIVCEGKTDSIYLKYAIRSLAAAFPTLATVTPGKSAALSVRVPPYPLTATGRILKLRGGTGLMGQFITDYGKELERFRAPGKQNPVILLIDCDDGKKPVYSAMQQFNKIKPTGQEPFIHVTANLYVVSTPLAHGKQSSMIEDAFGTLPNTLKVNGKSFNPDEKTFDQEHHYDKHTFSQYVKDNASKIDFSGFMEILARLAAAIEAYRVTQVPPAAPNASP
jgi:RNA-directed DNA polymerase